MIGRRFGAVALAAALTAALGACGDDGGSDEAASEDTTTTTEAAEETTTTEGDSGEEPSGGGDIDFGNLEECTEVGLAYASLGLALFGGALGAGDPNAEPIDFEELVSEVEAITDDVPDDVADDFQTVIDTYRQVLDDLGGDISTIDFADPDTAEALEALDSDEFTEANEAVGAYLEEVCGSTP